MCKFKWNIPASNKNNLWRQLREFQGLLIMFSSPRMFSLAAWALAMSIWPRFNVWLSSSIRFCSPMNLALPWYATIPALKNCGSLSFGTGSVYQIVPAYFDIFNIDNTFAFHTSIQIYYFSSTYKHLLGITATKRTCTTKRPGFYYCNAPSSRAAFPSCCCCCCSCTIRS